VRYKTTVLFYTSFVLGLLNTVINGSEVLICGPKELFALLINQRSNSPHICIIMSCIA